MFKVSAADALQAQAYELAMKDAREKGEHLAKLAGAQLGKVVAVSHGPPREEQDITSGRAYVAMVFGAMSGAGDEDTYTSETLDEIPITISLLVRFELD